MRVMSIHRSKGLEFPIVLLCGLGRNFNRQDERASVVLHSAQGLCLRTYDPARRAVQDNLLRPPPLRPSPRNRSRRNCASSTWP